jgi:hypothetical protein
VIVKALDLSTSHVPLPKPSFGDIRYVKHEYGWVLFVGGEPEVPEWLQKIWDFAKKNGCVLLNFDRDASESPDFDTFES